MAPSFIETSSPLSELPQDPLRVFKSSHSSSKPSLPSQSTPRATGTYKINEEPIGTRRPLRVVCMGAGYSGLMMAIIFSQKMQDSNAEFVIYERNKDLGGTWLENRYPGCQCDIPSHNYAFSFEANPDFPNYYATSEQLHQYMCGVNEKYQTGKYMNFSHEIKSAIWDEAEAKWKIKVQNRDRTFDDKCDVFINAGGVLNAWKYPNIEGISDFKGKLLHSASWDPNYDFANKKIAVIGIGSSGIQIVPKLAPTVDSLTLFVRSKTWISPAPGINEPTANDPETDSAHNYAPHVLQKFKEDPNYLLQHRRDLMDRRIDNFKRAHADSEPQRKAAELFKQTMTERLGTSEKGKKLAEMLIPEFPVGCRRQTPGPNFLEVLTEDNVDTRWDDIAKITEKGILTRGGQEIEVDAIVCATGFDTSFQPRFPIIGRGGASLSKQWEEVPEAYFGMAVPNFPNYFCFIGPNFPISNGSLVLGVQAVSIYIYKAITKLQTESIRSLEITAEANEDYNEHIQSYLQRTVWVGGCRSWYKKGTVDGRVVAIYGGTTFHYTEAIKNPRWEDYRIEFLPGAKGSRTNRFAYLGNGYTKRETRGGTIGETQTLDFEDYWNLLTLPPIYD